MTKWQTRQNFTTFVQLGVILAIAQLNLGCYYHRHSPGVLRLREHMCDFREDPQNLDIETTCRFLVEFFHAKSAKN